MRTNTYVWYAYVTPTVKRSYVVAERFVPVDRLADARGFRSVYFYSESTVRRVIDRKNFRDLRTESVRSEELLVDFDSKPDSAHALADKLREEGIEFFLYSSGNRSLHLHIATEPQEGSTVAFAQKDWVKTYAPDADTSIYHNAGLYRLPGTWHEKNPGHRKELLEHYQGSYALVIDPWVRKPPASVKDIQARVSPRLLHTVLKDRVSEGGRRCHVWRIGTVCYDLGLDFADAVSNAYKWNSTNAVPPLDSDIIERKVREAYEQRAYY